MGSVWRSVTVVCRADCIFSCTPSGSAVCAVVASTPHKQPIYCTLHVPLLLG
ncbi:hypothetical protein PgNI_05606 [Pyricularia grisea]|uniref:Uncharacterized protein n=1 Tax=Pyricularia grisea TaxID=148305 RepID=A0A6P8B6J6_PYRGI|nr:hypothetical protein PgNI_05606 [Pyricularia grisea]TLD10888.1 hypothetical protein PgNI_05606 [Pyricularia grisea]